MAILKRYLRKLACNLTKSKYNLILFSFDEDAALDLLLYVSYNGISLKYTVLTFYPNYTDVYNFECVLVRHPNFRHFTKESP